jgi:hypothetical protein
MGSARVARLTEGMSLVDIQREMHKLGDFVRHLCSTTGWKMGWRLCR